MWWYCRVRYEHRLGARRIATIVRYSGMYDPDSEKVCMCRVPEIALDKGRSQTTMPHAMDCLQSFTGNGEWRTRMRCLTDCEPLSQASVYPESTFSTSFRQIRRQLGRRNKGPGKELATEHACSVNGDTSKNLYLDLQREVILPRPESVTVI